MSEDLAFEHPNLDATHTISCLGGAVGEIDIGAQRMQRYSAFPVPFHTGDLGATQPAGAIDPNALRAEADGGLHSAFHRPAKGDAPLELLGDAVGDQLGFDLGLSDLDDVKANLAVSEFGEIGAQLLEALSD